MSFVKLSKIQCVHAYNWWWQVTNLALMWYCVCFVSLLKHGRLYKWTCMVL